MSKLTEVVYRGEAFSIEAYCLDDGESLVIQWLDGLPQKHQVRLAVLFERLGDHGKIYNEQKFKHLTGTEQLFEFKVDNVRVLSFFFSGKRVILTHGLVKKSAKTPKREIERAHKIKSEFVRRFEDENK